MSNLTHWFLWNVRFINLILRQSHPWAIISTIIIRILFSSDNLSFQSQLQYFIIMLFFSLNFFSFHLLYFLLKSWNLFNLFYVVKKLLTLDIYDAFKAVYFSLHTFNLFFHLFILFLIKIVCKLLFFLSNLRILVKVIEFDILLKILLSLRRLKDWT